MTVDRPGVVEPSTPPRSAPMIPRSSAGDRRLLDGDLPRAVDDTVVYGAILVESGA
jgi:hypothetical protein